MSKFSICSILKYNHGKTPDKKLEGIQKYYISFTSWARFGMGIKQFCCYFNFQIPTNW